MIAAAPGVDLALLVAEPTVSGLSDLRRALAITSWLEVRAVVCVNKADLNPELGRRIAGLCSDAGVELAGNIPFDETVEEASGRGVPVTEIDRGPVRGALERIWLRLAAQLEHAALHVSLPLFTAR